MRKAAKGKPAAKKATKKAAPKRAAPRKKPVKPIPDGYHVVTAYLAIDGAAKAIDFYKRVFGARERMRMEAPGGKIGHAELKIGDSVIMLADEYPDMDFIGPKTRGGASVTLHLYVKDCDAVVAGAVAAGAKVRRPVKDEFYGDRTGTIEDPFGHVWSVSTHKEELSKSEMRRRAAEAMKQMGG
jgi:PhnB protein